LDATTPIQIYVTKPPPSPPQQQPQPQQSSTKKQAVTRVLEAAASPTGPLLLPLLSILTDMPLHKQLVVDLKVNRCIKKLKRQLDQAIASLRAQCIDDQQWTDPVAGGLIVEQVNTAIEKLMNKWEQQTKSSMPLTKTLDLFQSLQSKMEQRLELLKKFEMGDIEKPSFLAKFEEQECLQKEQEEMLKLTTEQCAAREREQEKQQMLKTTKKHQEQAKAQKEMLLKKNKEARMKQKAEGTPLDGNEKRIRRVRWKDSFDNADHVRR
jgi:DNA polymerase III alpha subunit (gram-positive type)